MTAAAAVRLLNSAKGQGLIDWNLSVGVRDSGLSYSVSVTPRRRRKDGAVGRQWDRPLFFSVPGLVIPEPVVTPESALLAAADFVEHEFMGELRG